MNKWHFLIITGIFPLFLTGQNEVDSLLTALDNTSNDSLKVHLLILLWENTAYTNPGKAKKYARQALDFAKKTGSKRGMADAYQRIASGYSVRNINDSAQYFYEKSIDLYRELNDSRMVGAILTNMAMIYYDQGEYVKALLLTEESLKKSSEADDREGIAITLQLLGNIHHFMGNYDEAQKYLIQSLENLDKNKNKLRYADGLVYLASNYQARNKSRKALINLKEASEIYKAKNDSFYLTQAMNNIGFIYYKMDKYDSAIYFLNKAIPLASITGNNAMMILALNNLGLVNKALLHYDKAGSYFDSALNLAYRYNDQLRIAMISRNIGDLSAARNQYQKAIALYDSAINVGSRIQSKSSLKSSYLSMSEAWGALGNYKKSLAYFKQYEAMKDSIFNEDKTRKIEEMEARYEKAKHEKEIAIQKSEIEILSKDVELQTIRQRILIGGLILSLLLGFYFILHFRKRMKRNRLIREQEKLLEEQKLKNIELQRDNYQKELEIKKNELTSHALQIVQKNELLKDLKNSISVMEDNAATEDRTEYRRLKFMINGSAQTDREWENFNRHFEKVHQGFLTMLKTEYPVLTSNDLRLSAMLKLNLSSKEVAAIMNISPESVKKARYRLRKKLELPEETDLHAFMMNIGN